MLEYVKICQIDIRKDIKTKEKNMSTIKQIAAIAGVSRGTVDRVLNNRGGVNQETEQRIREIAAALNYSPSKAGRTLAIMKKNLKFGFVLFSRTESNPFFGAVEEGILTKAEELQEYGATVDIQYSNFDSWERQIEILDYFKENNYSGVAITSVNHSRVSEKISELADCGIPVVTVNSDAEDSRRIAYVGSNYRLSGRTAAGLMNLICRGQANIGIVSGSRNILCHTGRVQGFTERIAEAYRGLHITDIIMNHDDNIESYLKTKEMLEEHSDIDSLFLVAGGIQGACRAAVESGRKLSIISFDCIPETRQLIEDGIIAATIDQQPFYQGSMPLEILFNIVSTGVLPQQTQFFTDAAIIIQENLYD